MIKKYAKFVSNNPWKVLLFAVLLTIFLSFFSVGNNESDYSDMIPDKYPVVQAFNTISENFEQSESVTIVIELDSGDINDVRDPRVLEYADLISKQVEYVSYFRSVSSITNDIEDVFLEMPKSLAESRKYLQDTRIVFEDQYISSDKSVLLIKVSLDSEAANDDVLVESELREIIALNKKPEGVKVDIFGSVIEGPAINRLIAPEMAKTSVLSIFGIVLVLILIFRSIRYSFLPLTTIIFGVMWAMGFIGLLGFNMSSNSSGTISMIMGIGIDFGIQIISRFKEELKSVDKRKAIENTLVSTFGPIMTTTLAALIGFQAMSLGELTFMSEMGNIMSFGVLFCMVASITIVPSLLVLIVKKKK